MMNIRELESKLSPLTYEEIDVQMSKFKVEMLIECLDSKSIKVGDTAASLLHRRGFTDCVVDTVVLGKARTKLGKMRALYILHLGGKSCNRASEVYMKLIHDKNHDVINGALFGLVFLQDQGCVKAIEEAMLLRKSDVYIQQRFRRAIEAISKQDPFAFSPNFRDAANVWELDNNPFVKRNE